MSAETASWDDVARLPSFLERLAEAGGISIRDLAGELDLGIDVGGVVYHDRGIRVPAHDVTLFDEPRGSRGVPAFGVEVDTVGPRHAWAAFDASHNWDVYRLRSEDVAAVAWMSDGEFDAEEAEYFSSKAEAVQAGQFSFGVFVPDRSDWESQARSLNATKSPAFLQHEDGTTTYPRTQSEFYEYVGSTPEEFRLSAGGAPTYLGVLELVATVAD
ncbi:hypothetical protein OB905_06855 [Halobacteria archaeon AArc-dxtr1]|nr:hypothetical protein [Halobacteria archaeon AArc-dxtr1]